MIEVSITDDSGEELAHIRIEKLLDRGDGTADYSIKFGVDTADGFAVYQRSIDVYPRTKYNVLGLLRLALSALDEKELFLDGDPDQPRSSRNARASRRLARKLGRAL